jgi:uncharacterized DUF497 family protein
MQCVSYDFEWDIEKDKLNRKLHGGISFEAATWVFADPCRCEWYDGRENYGEDRWQTVGCAGSTMLFVVFTLRGATTIRIISARKANENERRKYRQENGL